MKLKQKSQISERTKKILADRKTGASIDQLAGIYNLSRQRIYQILKKNGDTLPKKLSTGGE
jgi:Mor family transcriptional regulator